VAQTLREMSVEDCNLPAPEEEVTREVGFTLIQSDRFRRIERDCAYKGFSRLFEEKMKVMVAKVSPDRWRDEGLRGEGEEGLTEGIPIEEFEILE